MLSLTSSTSARFTGTRSPVNCVIGCSVPASLMWKSSRCSDVTRRPSPSRTVTAVGTSSAPALNTSLDFRRCCRARARVAEVAQRGRGGGAGQQTCDEIPAGGHREP